MSLKFNPYIALAAAVVGAVAVDQVTKKTVTDPTKHKHVKMGVGVAALAASYFYGDKTTKALLLGLGVGGLATQVDVVQTKLLLPVEQKLLKA